MNEEPLVSVLMTSYNREKFIAEAIESVLASSYKNFELIICDDCSTDKTVETACRYLYNERVKVYVNDKNLGQFQNRNKSAEYAKGKYLKYVDSDDMIYPHTLKMMVDIMETFAECGFGFCHTSGNSKFPLPHKYTSAEIYNEHYFAGGILFTGPIGTIIRKDAFDKVGGFDFFGMPSDNHLSLKIAAQFPVVSMYRDLFWWRMHDDQAFRGETNDINIFNNFKWNYDILSNGNCPLDQDFRSKAIKNCKKIFIKNILKKVSLNPLDTLRINKIMQQQNINFHKIIKEVL